MSVPSIELITEAQQVWGRLRRGEITYGQLECELREIEARYGTDRLAKPCARCGKAEAAVTVDGRDICGKCANAKPMPTGDEIDRGWADYNDWLDHPDHRQAIGGGRLG